MDIQKRIKRLDDEHIAFRKKVSEYEWDYQDMRREAKNVSEQMSEWILSFCRNSPNTVPSYELSQIEENREIFERKKAPLEGAQVELLRFTFMFFDNFFLY